VRWHSCHLELILGFIRRNSPTVGLLSGRIFRVQVVMEGEDKFEVDPDWLMPEVTRLVPHGGRLDRAVRKLDNTYFDTPGAGLRSFRITLRQRVEGSETGWQLKVPSGTARTELRSSSRAKTLPPALADVVNGLLAGVSLERVATIKTTRTAYRLLNAEGALVLEIADDQVKSGRPDGQSTLASWREIQVELGPAGKNKDLRRAGKLLGAAGATPSTLRTRLDRALGPTLPNGRGLGVESSTVGGLVASYIAAQCDVLASNDIGLRTGAQVVHATRVAARRLRSTLRVFGDVVDTAPAEELNNELVWYADLLGQVRDQEVLSARLTTLIDNLPPEQVRGPVEAEITKALATEQDDATQRLNEAMRTPRYQHLMQLLRGWKTAPPLSDAADRKDKTASTYVKVAKRKADKLLRNAADDIDQLHRARRAMKRLRYAAELVEPADDRIKGIASDAKEMQTLLGEHQDALLPLSSSRRLVLLPTVKAKEVGSPTEF
jgi:CHAD domain-containing protein